jgi:hypothetical protein
LIKARATVVCCFDQSELRSSALQKLFGFRKAPLILAERSQQVIHASDDLRVCNAVLSDDLAGKREELICHTAIILHAAGVCHERRRQHIELEILRLLRAPIGDLPCKVGEAEGFLRAGRKTPTALLKEQLNESRATESAASPFNTLGSFVRRKWKEILEISLCPAQHLRGYGSQPAEKRRNDEGKLTDNGSPGAPFRLKRLELFPTMRTAAQQVLRRNLLEKAPGQSSLFDPAQDLAREVDVIHRQASRSFGLSCARA